jgi:hypothetical protein
VSEVIRLSPATTVHIAKVISPAETANTTR